MCALPARRVLLLPILSFILFSPTLLPLHTMHGANPPLAPVAALLLCAAAGAAAIHGAIAVAGMSGGGDDGTEEPVGGRSEEGSCVALRTAQWRM